MTITNPTEFQSQPPASASNLASGLDRSYLPELDGLRFFAFLMVFGFHRGMTDLGGWIRDIFAMTIDLPFLLIFGSGGIGGWLGNAVDHALMANGWIGVNLFFTLSGFIITRLLIEEESRFGNIRWGSFWIRRILRIWPLYYLVFLIGFFGIPGIEILNQKAVGINSPHARWFATFLGNWSMIKLGPVSSDILSVLWSVCVEEQFYLFIPVALSLTGRRGRILFCVTGILAAVFRRWTLARLEVPQYQMTFDTFAQMDGILSGVLLAVLVHSENAKIFIIKTFRIWHVYLFLIATLVLLTRRHLGHDVFERRVFDPLVISLFSVSWVLLAALGSGGVSALLVWKPFVVLGRISYGLYLWHEVVLAINGSGFLSLFSIILIAFVSYYGFERPVLRLKKKWSRIESRPL